jgi:hypothetical protein
VSRTDALMSRTGPIVVRAGSIKCRAASLWIIHGGGAPPPPRRAYRPSGIISSPLQSKTAQERLCRWIVYRAGFCAAAGGHGLDTTCLTIESPIVARRAGAVADLAPMARAPVPACAARSDGRTDDSVLLSRHRRLLSEY